VRKISPVSATVSNGRVTFFMKKTYVITASSYRAMHVVQRAVLLS